MESMNYELSRGNKRLESLGRTMEDNIRLGSEKNHELSF